MAKKHHVVPQDWGWVVKTEGKSERSPFEIVYIYRDKGDAIDAAREKAHLDGSDLVIHGSSGQVIQRPIEETTMNEDAVRLAVRTLANGRSPRLFTRAHLFLDPQDVKRKSSLGKSGSTKSMKTKPATNLTSVKKTDEE